LLTESWEDILEKLLSSEPKYDCFPPPEKLYEEVWSEPVATVAKRYNISDVGLAKRCRRWGIPLPPRGFWTRLKAGKSVSPRPPFPGVIAVDPQQTPVI
jgi:hypothetical protein